MPSGNLTTWFRDAPLHSSLGGGTLLSAHSNIAHPFKHTRKGGSFISRAAGGTMEGRQGEEHCSGKISFSWRCWLGRPRHLPLGRPRQAQRERRTGLRTVPHRSRIF